MEPFEHVDAPTVGDARALLAPAAADGGWAARPLAGGTDLLTTLKAGLHEPVRLVNLKRIPGLAGIAAQDGGLRLGALVTLDTLDRDPQVRARYTALAEAAALAASPQLRNMGTLGGNLAQEPRCWYYRSPDFPCWLKGGEWCYARHGENSHHAIFTEDSRCVSVYPGDPATALLALDAQVRIATAEGERAVPIGDYFVAPQPDHRRTNILGPQDLIVAVDLPGLPEASASTYLKAMDRAAWSFALASVAVVLTWQTPPGGDGPPVVARARIALGGVAPVPRRATAAEAALAGQALDAAAATEAGRLAVEGATPLEHNAYKVTLVRGLVARALRQLAGIEKRDAGAA